MTVAMYLRLSSEDIDLKSGDKTESESISNQRGLLKEFLRGRPEFTGAEILEFCDDGWSGKNFERPAFVQMMEQVKTGKIHCIVVKDLSRFGRDYLVVGNYISRVFPFLGVRFIAVNDGFDSTRQADIDSLDTSFTAASFPRRSKAPSGSARQRACFSVLSRHTVTGRIHRTRIICYRTRMRQRLCSASSALRQKNTRPERSRRF